MSNLRKQVKALKAFQNISYATIAKEIGISRGAFYNWLHDDYEFSYKTEYKLKEYIRNKIGE